MENQETNNLPTETKEGGAGAIIGAVIIIVLLVLGAWYFIGNRLEKIQESKGSSAEIEVMTGDSTEVADIQTDLDNLDVDVLLEE